jgi:hypothetical protein
MLWSRYVACPVTLSGDVSVVVDACSGDCVVLEAAVYSLQSACVWDGPWLSRQHQCVESLAVHRDMADSPSQVTELVAYGVIC